MIRWNMFSFFSFAKFWLFSYSWWSQVFKGVCSRSSWLLVSTNSYILCLVDENKEIVEFFFVMKKCKLFDISLKLVNLDCYAVVSLNSQDIFVRCLFLEICKQLLMCKTRVSRADNTCFIGLIAFEYHSILFQSYNSIFFYPWMVLECWTG